MTTQTVTHRGHSFAFGLFAGAFLGAGFVMWLGSKAAAEPGRHVSTRSKRLRTTDASDAGSDVTARTTTNGSENRAEHERSHHGTRV